MIDVIIRIMHEISWPLAFLIIGLLAAFGGLDKPLKSVSAGIVSFFKEFRDFRSQLEGVESKLKDITSSSPDLIKTIDAHVQALQSSLNEKLAMIEKEIVTTRERVTQESLAVETGSDESADGNDSLLPAEAAKNAIAEIVSAWRAVTQALEDKYQTAKRFDRREYGQAVIKFANGSARQKPSDELAEKISALHSRFKGFTRRQSYAEEWFTAAMRDGFMQDANNVIAELKS